MVTRAKLILLVLSVGALSASHWAMWQWGQAKGVSTEAAACATVQIAGLSKALRDIRQAADEANAASLAIGRQISARQQADNKATQELRDALHRTAAERVDCVFDDGVMRALAAARNRANAAAASGVDSAVPAAAGDTR